MSMGDVVSVIGALGIGSFIGQYLIGAHQRRSVRSAVLEKLAQTEAARWARTEPHDPPFPEAIHGLETAALVARLPRRAITQYRVMAYTAWWLSNESFEEDPDPEFAGGISSEVANATRAAASEISRLAWSPWSSRIRLSARLKALTAEADAIEDPASFKSLFKHARDYAG